ncbi:hypothetical protein PV726_40225 [Streptomyces europaeiscabiei]|uniref:hypothetical protein n=1 Tax=Streptomyces europaeiscabiei TaxID=146819 RepID=UPI00299FBA50|nr:hypothetical protein [Streptomyces europaeiscabiei]MDX3696422.1 hypothetical protein [Streptomyces europaeiscabiei]
MTTTSEPGSQPRTSAPTAQHRTRFFDHRIPALHAGRYIIGNQHTLKNVDGADRTVDATPQPFDVVEPRFSFDPTGINAQFPVPDAEGTYSQTLAHINLDAPGLPWNRLLGPNQPPAVPWMALLLFRKGELPEDPEAVGRVKGGTVRELLDGGLGTGEPPALESVRDDEYDEQCATILVPKAVFDAVKPLPAEMGYLAHLREGGRPDADHIRAGADPEPDEGELNAVLVANRFPAAAGGCHVVHLVSLEGFDQYLTAPAPSGGVRLVSLESAAVWFSRPGPVPWAAADVGGEVRAVCGAGRRGVGGRLRGGVGQGLWDLVMGNGRSWATTWPGLSSGAKSTGCWSW